MKGVKFRKNNEQYYPDARYEVGDLYLTTNSENPSVRFGGTWELYGPGRGLVCVDSADAILNASKKTGGSTNPLSSHQHYGEAWTNPGGNHNHIFNARWEGPNRASGAYWSFNADNPNGQIGTTYSGDHQHYFGVTVNAQGDNTNHNNWQPFITCYIWIRTA